MDRGFLSRCQHKRLRYYSQFFDTAEIDSTFYEKFYTNMTKGTFIGMSKASPEKFQFSVKVPETITHIKRLRTELGAFSDFEEFLEKISPLNKANKLGAVLFQLPPSFTVSEFKNVERFLDKLPKSASASASNLSSSSSLSSPPFIVGAEWDTGLRIIRSEVLESKALFMESRVTETAIEKKDVDIISIDGSLASRFINNKPDDIMRILDILKRKNNVIFVSKNSDTKTQFDSMGAKAADIFYFNHIGNSSAGFSTPFVNNQTNQEHGNIIEIYARLKECTPLTKIEISDMTASQINNAEIKKILDMLSFHTVSGYPYCLKLAHQNCKISKRDIDRLVGFYRLKNEAESRDPLNE